MKEESANKPRQATLPEALLSFLLLVLIMSIGIIVYK